MAAAHLGCMSMSGTGLLATKSMGLSMSAMCSCPRQKLVTPQGWLALMRSSNLQASSHSITLTDSMLDLVALMNSS